MKQVIHGHSAVIGVGLLALLAGIPNLASASPQDSAGELKRMHRDEAAMPPGVGASRAQLAASKQGSSAGNERCRSGRGMRRDYHTRPVP